jgi:hypothetical protein
MTMIVKCYNKKKTNHKLELFFTNIVDIIFAKQISLWKIKRDLTTLQWKEHVMLKTFHPYIKLNVIPRLA